MNNRKKNIDRGKLLKSIVEKSGISIVKLIKKVGYKDRGSYYSHIDKPDLSLEILFAYAKALKYDLREEFPEVSQFMAEEPFSNYHVQPESLPDALQLLDRWKDRYYLLLEKYSTLMERTRE